MNLTPQQKRKLERLLKLGEQGLPAILEYLYELEDKIDSEIPSLKGLLDKVKGDKGDTGDTYELTQADKKQIASIARDLVDVYEVADIVLDKIDVNSIAQSIEANIVVPKPNLGKLKQEVLDSIVIPPPIKGDDGKDADEEIVAKKVEVSLIKNLPSFGEQFRDGLELLQKGDRLKIDFIDGIEDYPEVARLAKASQFLNRGGNGKGLLSQMNDVNIQDPTNGQVLKYDSTNKYWYNSTGGGGGGLNSFTSPDDSLVIGGTLTDPTAEINYAHAGTWTAEQSNTSIFLNNSDIDWSAGAGNDIVIAAGGNAGGNWLGFLWDSTNSVVKLQDLSGNLYDFQVDTLTANDAIVATTISATTGVYSTLRATGSGGLLFESNSGTDVALFGAGGGAGATFYGGVNIDGNLAVDTNVLFVDTSLNQVIIGATSGSSKLSVVTNSIGASPSTTSGLSLENTTAASAGSQQVSPSILLRSKGWGTTLGSSQSVDWQSYSLPVQGTAPTGRMIWASSINGGAYTKHMNLSTLGNLNVGYDGQTDFGSRGTFINASGVNGKILTLGRDNANYMWHLGISTTSYFSVYDNDGTTVRLTIAPTTGFTGIGLGTTGATSMLHVKASGSTSATSAFRIWNAGSADRLVYRDDGRLWLGTGTPSYNALLNLDSSGTQTEIQFTTNATGRTSTDGFYMQYTDAVGARYLLMENKPHVFYIGGSEVARFSETGAIMQVTGTLAAQYSGAGSSRGGAISLISSAGTAQDWIMATAGTDNSVVNGRSWFLYDNTSGVARFFVDKSSRIGVGLGATAATSFVDIAASTSAIAQLRMRAGVAVSAPNDGELWYENTNDRLMFEKNTTACEIVSASAVTTEVVVSDTTLTITYNGVTYKLLAKA